MTTTSDGEVERLRGGSREWKQGLEQALAEAEEIPCRDDRAPNLQGFGWGEGCGAECSGSSQVSQGQPRQHPERTEVPSGRLAGTSPGSQALDTDSDSTWKKHSEGAAGKPPTPEPGGALKTLAEAPAGKPDAGNHESHPDAVRATWKTNLLGESEIPLLPGSKSAEEGVEGWDIPPPRGSRGSFQG